MARSSLLAAAGALGLAVALAQTVPPQEGDDLQVWTCGASSAARQTWIVETSSTDPLGRHIVLASSRNDSVAPDAWLVMDIAGWSNNTGAEIHIWYNTTGRDGVNEQWAYNTTSGQIRSTMSNLCAATSAVLSGMPVRMATCSAAGSALDSFDFEPATGLFHLRADPTLCLDAGTSASCSEAPYNTYTYCNPDASVDDRVADLIPRLTPPDFQALLDSTNPGIPRLGIPKIQFGECLHGPLTGCGAPYTDPTTGYTSTGCPTSLPHSLLQGGTFNRTLWSLVGNTISTEVRALHNQGGIAASVLWAPDINEFRDPRWGRGQEVPGECPFLTSEWVYRYSSGLQVGEDPRYIKAASTAKHLFAYDLESSDGTWRGEFNAVLTAHDMVEYYLPAFRSAFQRAHVAATMCSYNAETIASLGIDAVPSCADGFVINGIVRGQWNWQGHVVSDCGAIEFIYDQHHYVDSYVDAVGVAIRAGTDVNCGDVYDNYIVPAYANGTVTLSDLQAAGSRLMRTAFLLGLVDPPERVVYTSYNATMVDTPAHRQLALEAAQQGIILLQNNATATPWGAGLPLLPLRAASLKKIAVIGPNANATLTLLSNYHGDNRLVANHSILAAVQARGLQDGFSVDFEVGCWQISCPTNESFPAAVAAAQAADVAIVVVGLCSDNCPGGDSDNDAHEGEGHDRLTTDFPGQQEALIRAVAATGRPVVVVLVHGGAISMDWTAGNMPAIVDALYPGELGGDAVANILFGDVSPSGRTVTTWYPTSFQTARQNVSDMALPPHTGPEGQQVPGITYLYYDGPVLYPFGWGLSYTTFSYSWVYGQSTSVDAAAFGSGAAGPPAFAVNVTNTGAVTSDVSVLAFFSSNVAGEPLQELYDFARAAAVAPGQTVQLTFSLPPEVAARVDEEGTSAVVPGTYEVRIGDVLASGNFVRGQVEVTGAGPFELFSLKKAKADYDEAEAAKEEKRKAERKQAEEEEEERQKTEQK